MDLRLDRARLKLFFGMLVVICGALSARANAGDSEPSRQVDPRDLASRLGVTAYDPIYFIVGGDGGFNAKFQISFKYQLLSPDGFMGDSKPHLPGWLSHFYLGYTQTSLWDLNERSSPFKDTSYRPRFFYAHDSLWESENDKWQLGIEGGYAHESNGQSDPNSRSIHLAYARPTLSYHVNMRYQFYVAPFVAGYIDKLENPDINDYRGNVDLLLGFGNRRVNIENERHVHDWNAWAILRKGDKKNYGSVELNLAIPGETITGGRLNGWFLLQYFDGWGESIIDYNRKLHSQFRAGLAITVQ